MINMLMVSVDGGEPVFINTAHIVKIGTSKASDPMNSQAIIYLMRGRPIQVDQTVATLLNSMMGKLPPGPPDDVHPAPTPKPKDPVRDKEAVIPEQETMQ